MNRTIFPTRVWFETASGWASREATKFDHKRRKEWLAQYDFRRFQRVLADSTKVPDTVLRRGT